MGTSELLKLIGIISGLVLESLSLCLMACERLFKPHAFRFLCYIEGWNFLRNAHPHSW